MEEPDRDVVRRAVTSTVVASIQAMLSLIMASGAMMLVLLLLVAVSPIAGLVLLGRMAIRRLRRRRSAPSP